MYTYLVTMCKKDGSTPLGECPEYEVEGINRYIAYDRALHEHPDEEVVSIGRKDEIEAFKKGLYGL